MGFKVFESVPKETDSPLIGETKFTKQASLENLVARLDNKNDVVIDSEIKDAIRDNFDLIFDYDLFFTDTQMRPIALKLFTNEKFVVNLTSILTSGLKLTGYQTFICNKIAYDFIQENGLDHPISNKLFTMANVVNYQSILKIDEHLPAGYSPFISIVRRSSLDEKLNIKRLNNFLINCNIVWDPQTLIDLYSKLFDHMSLLFNQTMLEQPSSSFTGKQYKNYENISRTMLYILDNMTSVEMEKLLRSYSNYYEVNRLTPRFSLHKLDRAYVRIQSVVDKLDIEGITLP